jgi:RNase P subunit RPR2
MVAIHCSECETLLQPVAPEIRSTAPYASLWMTCPRCGAAWHQNALGELTQVRQRLVRVPIAV